MDQAEVRKLFMRALEIGTEQQTAFLDAATVSAETRDAVLRLLHYDRGAEQMLDFSIARERGATQIGDRFGVYEIRELLGRGGMGAVFKAERTDAELQQIVAIKILEYARLDPKAVERFRRERQILAGLTHPNIVRLLDGGTRDDGVPYLVMEYVAGLPLDQYSEQHDLGLAGRLRLFLPICDAVAYAHSSLIVHRDLKPANILVTPEGEARLLDFGVATVLQAGVGSQTQTLALTPQFASPEQARGDPVTTATDVYGLGAILYYLLTGRVPHESTGLSIPELQRSICESEPVLPSRIRPELSGDLENILRKALHIDPARRYRYAAELAEDVQRYLDHRPVVASPDTIWYRSSRFLRRHRIAAAAGLVTATAIALGTGVSLYEGRQAQRRFDQVRGLANRFLFDFENSIHDLPGALPARRMVVATAREYLQSLSSDARNDQGLSRELAESHVRLSMVESDLGQSEDAIADLRHAIALHKNAHDDCCGPAAQRLNYIRALTEQSRVLNQARRPDIAFNLAKESVRLAQEWKNTEPREPLAERALVTALTQQGACLEIAGRRTEAIHAMTEGVDRGAVLVKGNPGNDELLFEEARAAFTLADLLSRQNDPAKTRLYAAQARELLDVLLARSPQNRSWRLMRIRAVSSAASALKLLAQNDESVRPQALQNAKAAYEMSKEEVRNDPRDMTAAELLNVMTQRWALHLREAGHLPEAVSLLKEAAAQLEGLIATDPKTRRYRYLRQNTYGALGELYIELGKWQLADETLARHERYITEALAEAPDDAITLKSKVDVFCYRAQVDWHLGRFDRAREQVRRGLELAASMLRKDPVMEKYLGILPGLRSMAKQYGVPDPTLNIARAEPRQSAKAAH